MLELWNNAFTSLRCSTWLVAWVSFCMLSSAAHWGCFKALDNSLILLGSFQCKVLNEFIVVFYESQEKMWLWALWSAVCLLLSWCNGFLLEQTKPGSCFATLSSPGVKYRGGGWEGISPVCALPWCWHGTARAIHTGSWCFPLHLPVDSCRARAYSALGSPASSPRKNLHYSCSGKSLHTVGFSWVARALFDRGNKA